MYIADWRHAQSHITYETLTTMQGADANNRKLESNHQTQNNYVAKPLNDTKQMQLLFQHAIVDKKFRIRRTAKWQNNEKK